MNIAELFEREEAKRLAELRAEEDAKTDDQRRHEAAQSLARLEAFHRQGVESGAWDEDGNDLEQPEEEEDEPEEDEE